MQKDSWNVINLHQILNIETLQIMELKKEKKLNNSIYNAPLAIFQKMFFFKNIIHTPCDSFYCVWTQFMNFEPTWSYKIEIRTLKPIVFEVIKLKPLFNLQPLRL
jgi:hypothetical protein